MFGSVGIAGTGGVAGAAKFSGAPIHIAMLTDLTAPAEGFNFTEAAGGAEAAVDAVNAAGGIHGHKLELTICNGKGTPNAEDACARTAVKSKAVATIGGAMFINAMAPILCPAHIAEIMENPALPAELAKTATCVFPVNGSAFLGSIGELEMATKYIHATKVSLMAVGSAAGALYASVKAVAPSLGAKVVETVTVTGSTTTLTPDVEQAASNGSQAIILLMPPTNSARVIAALHENDIKVPPITITLTPQDLKSLGSTVAGAYEINYFPTLNDTAVPGVKMFLSEMKKYEPTTLLDGTSMIPWLGVHMFAEVASKLKTVTRQSVLQAWTTATDVNGYGLIPPYSTNKPYTGLGGLFPRAFNDTYWYAKFKGTTAYLLVDHAVSVPAT
ncbi:MAG: ABC transporter substrate-binding protein [Nitrososphaerales archaeon]